MSAALASAILALLHAQGAQAGRLCGDSRRVQPGDVFLAYPGHRTDGRRYLADAVARGAAAVLWERDGFDWPAALALPNLPVDQLSWLAGWLADQVCGQPSEHLWLVGVTGTNGKTSVSQWLARAYAELGRPCGVIGTLGMGFPGALDESVNTTPDAVVLQQCLAQLRERGAQAATMEVSSIGLDQGRINGCRVDVAVLTNLTRDHLDYHGSMEAYGEAKARMFAQPGLRSAVLNFDDTFGVGLARRLAAQPLEVVGYTVFAANVESAPAARVLVAEGLQSTGSGMVFRVRCGERSLRLRSNVVGQFNVSNLLAVVGTLIQSGYALEDAVAVAETLTPPQGRMETVGGFGEPLVVVDYAHTPDALEQALVALRETVAARGGRLICVFGCGGDRDPGKRPLMGEVATRLADQVVLTSDNPRSERPIAIIEQIAAGAPGARHIEDRSAAILAAVAQAGADDVVLIAGKGHEPYQEVAGVRHAFRDTEEARLALAEWNRLHGETEC